jgi:hypothetical protein
MSVSNNKPNVIQFTHGIEPDTISLDEDTDANDQGSTRIADRKSVANFDERLQVKDGYQDLDQEDCIKIGLPSTDNNDGTF